MSQSNKSNQISGRSAFIELLKSEGVEQMRRVIPLLKMDWMLQLHNWGEVKDEEDRW